GIGATTAAYSVVDRVLLHPLPFDHPERLVQLWQSTPAYHRIELSPPNFYDWRRMSRSFEAMSAYASYSWTFMDQGDPKRLDGTAVTPEFFNVLDVKPALGRLFKDEDGRVGVGHTVILSYSFWQDVFGGSPDVLTKTIRLDNDPY